MSIVMNMSNYVVEEISGTEYSYRDDSTRGGSWPLQLALQPHGVAVVNKQTPLPPSLATVDVDIFLHRMCASRR